MKFTSYGGELEILSDGRLKIQKGKNTTCRIISFKDIVSVTLVKPMLTVAGCIYVQVYGGKTYSPYATAASYAADANAICFRKSQYDEALAFKDALDNAVMTNK